MMSKIVISDLPFLQELNSEEIKIAGGASSGGSSGADYRSSVSSVASTTDGNVDTGARGASSRYDYYYGSYDDGPSTYAYTSDSYPYYYY